MITHSSGGMCRRLLDLTPGIKASPRLFDDEAGTWDSTFVLMPWEGIVASVFCIVVSILTTTIPNNLIKSNKLNKNYTIMSKLICKHIHI